MSSQTNVLDQHQLLASVRTLLATVQQPLDALDAALTAPEQLLAELAPALDVVDFSPFAQLPVNGADARQPAPKPALRSTGIPPAATTAAATTGSQASRSALPSSTRPGTALRATPTSDPTKTAPPVFSLPSQKRVTTVGASSSARGDISPDHSLAQPVTSPTTPLVGSEAGYTDHSAPLSSPGDDDQAHVLAATPMAVEQRTQQRSSSTSIDPIAPPPLATMSLLATVVDTLLATTPAGRLEAVSTQGASAPGAVSVPALPAPPTLGGVQWPTDMPGGRQAALPTNDNVALPFQQPPSAIPSTKATAADLATLLAGWPSVGNEDQPINGVPSGPTNQPTPDPWTLAQLINDVLAEEARRHGVDLS